MTVLAIAKSYKSTSTDSLLILMGIAPITTILAQSSQIFKLINDQFYTDHKSIKFKHKDFDKQLSEFH